MASFIDGEKVEYYSASHGIWMEARITAKDSGSGDVQVSVKPGYWMSKAEQQQRLRKLGSKKAAEFPMSAADYSGISNSQEWSADRALALGSCEVNELGARSTSELAWANVLSSQNSVHQAVDLLNRGMLSCPENVCVVYSKSSNCHYLLYKEGASRGGSTSESKLADLRMQLNAEIAHCDSLQAALALKDKALRELEGGSDNTEMLTSRLMELDVALSEEKRRNHLLQRELDEARSSVGGSRENELLLKIQTLEAELAAERKRCQELDNANLLLLDQQKGAVGTGSSPVARVVAGGIPTPGRVISGSSYTGSVVRQANDLFDQLDRNHDGVLDASEVNRLRPVQVGQPSQVVGVVTVPPVRTVAAATVRQPDLFDKLDSNRDGVLDASELARVRPLGQATTVAAVSSVQPSAAPRVVGGGLASLTPAAGGQTYLSNAHISR